MKKKYAKDSFLEILKQVPFISHAAKQCGVSRATIYRWLNSDRYFNSDTYEAIKYGRLHLVDVAEMGLIKKIKEGNLEAIKYFLGNNEPRYDKIEKAIAKKADKILMSNREDAKKIQDDELISNKERYEKMVESRNKIDELIKRYEECGMHLQTEVNYNKFFR